MEYISKKIDASIPPPLKPFIKYHPPKFSIRIALVALTLDEELDLDLTDLDGCWDPDKKIPYRLWKIKDELLPQIKERYIKAIDTAANSRAKIICFGELTYPFGSDPAENQEFKRKINNLARKKKLYIVAGSYHDFLAPVRERYNISLIFTPDRLEPLEQHKFDSAFRAGECCDLRPYDELNIVHTFYGNLAVCICMDAASHDIMFKIGKRNSDPKYQGVDFLIVPAFDPTKLEILERVEALSRTARTCAAFINTFEDRRGSGHQEPAFFKGGEKVEPEKVLSDLIYIYNVSSEDLENIRIQLTPIPP